MILVTEYRYFRLAKSCFGKASRAEPMSLSGTETWMNQAWKYECQAQYRCKVFILAKRSTARARRREGVGKALFKREDSVRKKVCNDVVDDPSVFDRTLSSIVERSVATSRHDTFPVHDIQHDNFHGIAAAECMTRYGYIMLSRTNKNPLHTPVRPQQIVVP